MEPDIAKRPEYEPLIFATTVVPEHAVRVHRQVAVLRAQVQELSAAVAVLIDLVAATSSLDRAAIEERVAAVLAPRCAPRPQPPVVCVRCHRSVPANTTVITADGVMCDPRCG